MATAQRRRPRITLDQLHTFLAVAEHEHVRKASAAIHLSQAAVSQQLRLLERSLGVPLFERTGRQVRLSSTGQALRDATSIALDAVRAVEDIATAQRGLEQGEVMIVAGNIIGQERLPLWMAPFLEQHPGIDVGLQIENTQDALHKLHTGAADIAVVAGPFDQKGLETALLERDELVIAVHAQHPLAQHRSPAGELLRYRYLARGQGSGTEELARRLLGSRYGRARVTELSQGTVQYGLLAGLGYAAMPRMVIAEYVEAGRLVVIALPRRTPVYQDFTAVRRAGPHPPAVDAFWRHLLTVRHGPGDAAGTGVAAARRAPARPRRGEASVPARGATLPAGSSHGAKRRSRASRQPVEGATPPG